MNPFKSNSVMNPEKTLNCINHKCQRECVVKANSKIYITQGGRFLSICSRCSLLLEYEIFKEEEITKNRIKEICLNQIELERVLQERRK